MKVKKRSVGVCFAVSMEEINSTLNFIQLLEHLLKVKDATSKFIIECEFLQKFTETNYSMSHYVFLVKKCKNS